MNRVLSHPGALALLAVVGACVVPPAPVAPLRPAPGQGPSSLAAAAPIPAAEPARAASSALASAAPVAPVAADVAVALARIESQLGRGEVHDAMADLTALSLRAPGDVRVGGRLGRLLHQRALGRYGGGALAAAIADWEQVLRLAPNHAAARALLATARVEAAAAQPR